MAKRDSSTRRKRADAVVIDHMGEIVTLIGRGWTQEMIALKLGISQQQVSLDYRRVLQAAKSNLPPADETVAAKLLELANLKRAAWEEWERSKEPGLEITTSENDFGTTTTEKRKGQCGDSKYLQVVADCIKQERSLRGLDAPKQLQVRGGLNNTNVNFDWSVFEGLDQDRGAVEARLNAMLEGRELPPPPGKISDEEQPLYSKGDSRYEEPENYEPPGEEEDE